MFTPEERNRLRSSWLEIAAGDPRISGAAITGSAAVDREDRWSDIDLAFGIEDAARVPEVLADWTSRMVEQHHALHHIDVRAGSWMYRVFLLPGTLQVDLAFVAAEEFRALAPSFRLVSGEAREPAHFPSPSISNLIGMGWLYALHARSSIARGNLWQAEYMVSGVRDQGLALACIRYGLAAANGRGIDQLPHEVKARFSGALVTRLDQAELLRAFRVSVAGLLVEIRAADQLLADRLHETLTELAETAL